MIAQTRYMPLEVEHRDDVQKELMKGVGPMLKLGHGDDLAEIGSKTCIENETLYTGNVHRMQPRGGRGQQTAGAIKGPDPTLALK